ncbi:pentatricopeptide repeat-containing protein At4g19191, mitochondrial-like [Rosa rugosa]|uniref:pentatricopeptide repeat-containing protein At4g19191, mitochondrial-like n=1 Tax=Rosa rugosa TaxID=74645 RepID=UPI002B40FBEB|nr:pentatricopeptide repeat-containing protein At4g19191, mitochondrial-like [Rosa rugosa]
MFCDVQIPSMPLLKYDEVPSFLYPTTPYPFLRRAILGQYRNLDKPFCILMDTFQELESEIIEYMSRLCPIKAVGPLFKNPKAQNAVRGDFMKADDSIIGWLDTKPKSSVVILNLYSCSESLIGYACRVFDIMPQRTVVTVNGMVSGFVKNDMLDEGVGLFKKILDCSFGLELKPNYVTLVVLVSGCVELDGFIVGKVLHSYCCKTGLDFVNEVCNAVIDLYSKFGHISEAARMFNEMPERDLIPSMPLLKYDEVPSFLYPTTPYPFLRRAILGQYRNLDKPFCILMDTFQELESEIIEYMSRLCPIKAVGPLFKNPKAQNAVRGDFMKADDSIIGWLDTKPKSSVVILNLYSCSESLIGYACRVFDIMPQRTVVTVNGMVSGFVKNDMLDEGVGLFKKILDCSFGLELKPNYVTLVVLVSGCVELDGFIVGKVLHSYCCKTGLDFVNEVCNAVIDLYSKFGHISEAARMFNEMPERDLVVWFT